MWYALAVEQERIRDLNMANMLVVASRGSEDDIKALFKHLQR